MFINKSLNFLAGFITIFFLIVISMPYISGENQLNEDIIKDHYAIAISPSIAEIRFDTDFRVKSKVYYGTSRDRLNKEEVINDYITRHSLYLKNLNSNAKYFYKIKISNKEGEEYNSEIFSVTTFNNEDIRIREEHPRVLLTNEEISQLKDKIDQGSELEDAWNKVKSRCNFLVEKTPDENGLYKIPEKMQSSWANLLSVCYLLSEDSDPMKSEYKEKAYEFALFVASLDTNKIEGNLDLERIIGIYRIPVVAPIYDSIYNDLNDEQREILRDKLYFMTQMLFQTQEGYTERIEGHATEYTDSLMIAGISLYGDFEQDQGKILFEDIIENYYSNLLPARRFFMGVDGGSFLGFGYSELRDIPFVHSAFHLNKAAENNQGILHQEALWLEPWAKSWIYGVRGDNSYLKFNDHNKLQEFDNLQYLTMRMLASGYNNEQLQWFVEQILETSCCKANTERNLVLDKKEDYLADILWKDFRVNSVEPKESDELSKLFRKTGKVIVRESWNPESVVAEFTSKEYYTGGHSHLDNLGFSIYYKGGQALDGGIYDQFGEEHHRNYYQRTIAHNSITIFDPSEIFCSATGRGHSTCYTDDNPENPSRRSNDGGQDIPQTTQGFRSIPYEIDELIAKDTPFVRGGIPIYEDTNEYTYSLGKGAPSYKAYKVDVVDRHFLWLKELEDLRHPVIIIFDQIEAKNQDYKKTYHLHVRNDININGNTIISANKNRVTGEEGVLYQTTLLPSNAEFRIKKGESEVFEVDGELFIPDASQTSYDITELEDARVEISAPLGNYEDQFLNVIYTTDKGEESNPMSNLIIADNMKGVKIKDWTVLFAKKELSIDETSYDATMGKHLLMGLKDSTKFDVLLNGEIIKTIESSKEGSLRFNLNQNGRVQIKIHSAENDAKDTLKLYMSFDDSNALDTTGNSNGIIIGNVNFKEGISGNAAEFRNGRIDIQNPPKLEQYTISTWIKTNSNSRDVIIWGTRPGSNRNLLYGIRVEEEAVILHNDGSNKKVYSRNKINDGEWHHIASGYDGIELKLYIDGELINSRIVKDLRTQYTGFLSIGAKPNNSLRFDGMIDELRIHNKALTIDEIKDLANLENFEDSNRPIESSNDLVARYNFENNARDIVGNKDGIIKNDAVFEEGIIGEKSLKFDGINNYVEFPDETLVIPSSKFTLSTWVIPKRSGGIIFWENDLQFYIGNNDFIPYFRFWDNENSYHILESSIPLRLDEWNHIVVVFDSDVEGVGKASIFINGELSAYKEVHKGIIKSNPSTNRQDLRIGVDESEGASNFGIFKGNIDDLRIYNYALTSSDIKELSDGLLTPNTVDNHSSMIAYYSFNDSTANDESINNNEGEIVGARTVKGKIQKAFNFDGRNDYIKIEKNNVINNMDVLTYSAWIYPTGDGNRQIISKKVSSREFRLTGTGNGLKLRGCVDTNPGYACSTSGTRLFKLNEWSHVAMTYNHNGDRKVHLFINGVEVNYLAQTQGSEVIVNDSNSDLWIGLRTRSDRPFKGIIDEVKIFNKALSLEEIRGLL